MEKKLIGNNFFIPMPVVLVGTQVRGKENFMTVGWCARANANPPMILCGIGNHHYTPRGIAETRTFSVNIPSSALLEKTDYCGIVSGEKTDKSQVFDVFYGSLKTAPMIMECPVNLECKVFNSMDCGSHVLVVGEIVETYAYKEVVSGSSPDIKKVDPIIYSEGKYYKIGEFVTEAFSAGRAYKK